MRVHFGEKQYDFRFRYTEVASKGTGQIVKKTLCTISRVDPNAEGKAKFHPITDGRSMQHPNDQFCRSTGRKIALKNALGHMIPWNSPDRPLKTAFWDVYFKHCDHRTLPVNKKANKRDRWEKKQLKEIEESL